MESPLLHLAPRLRKHLFDYLLFAFIPLFLAFGVSTAFGATTASAPRAVAQGMNGTEVEVNGARMSSGATLFPGDVIQTGGDSSAALQFGKNLVLVAPETKLAVDSEGVSLRRGRVQVRAAGSDSFLVSGEFFHVKIASYENAAAASDIQVSGDSAQVSSVKGAAELTADGNDIPYELHAGETATLDASGSDAAPGQTTTNPPAGQVSRLLPQVQIERASQQMVAAVSAPVYWNDDLRSGPSGRAHITLTDGSLLYLGSNSSLRILQHDAQAQQTSLDLVIGRMRGYVMRLSRPGAKFEIRTPVGAAGLVGTDFSLEVTPSYVELIVFEGVVRFTIFSNGQAITVPERRKLRIYRTGVFEGPQTVMPQEILAAQASTDIPAAPRESANPPRNKTRAAVIWIGTSETVAVVGIGTWLASREPVSHWKP